MEQNKSWSYVSCLFDLSKYDTGIGQRSKDWYHQKARQLKNLDAQKIIVGDAESLSKIGAEKWPNTFCIELDHSNLAFKYLDKLKKFKKKDQRWSPAWCCAVISKHYAIIEATRINPFNSDMFCYTDIAIYREHPYINFSLGEYLHSLLDLQKTNYQDKVNVGLINWVPTNQHAREFFFEGNIGRCTVSGGIFFGPVKLMSEMSNCFVQIFREDLDAGFCHADEQTLFRVIMKNLSLFRLFATDYFTTSFDAGNNPSTRAIYRKHVLVDQLRQDQRFDLLPFFS